MTTLKALWARIEGDPKFMRRLHAWLTVIWLVASLPICMWAFYDPENKWLIPILIFVSFYANTSGHWSAFQASRVEVRQDEIEEKHKDNRST